jgi:hypothetical protein
MLVLTPAVVTREKAAARIVLAASASVYSSKVLPEYQ